MVMFEIFQLPQVYNIRRMQVRYSSVIAFIFKHISGHILALLFQALMPGSVLPIL